jgi:hypothetical protein
VQLVDIGQDRDEPRIVEEAGISTTTLDGEQVILVQAQVIVLLEMIMLEKVHHRDQPIIVQLVLVVRVIDKKRDLTFELRSEEISTSFLILVCHHIKHV